MKKAIVSVAAAASMITGAYAGGIDRSGQSVGILFEEGNYLELSFGIVSPDISGVEIALLGGDSSGDMTESYTQMGAAYKHQFANGLEAALIWDQPFGADVVYPTGTGYFAVSSTAELTTRALTALIKYTAANNISVYGGLRYQTLEAVASVPFVLGYTGAAPENNGVGYVLGAAYEKSEIALRVALTYNSAIDHTLTTTETGAVPGTSSTPVTTPQSINLEFQSGVAADTLVFGSVRWVEWSKFDITPFGYAAVTGESLVSFNSDTISYKLGVGRKFNDMWSGAIILGYEHPTGGFASNLGPKDGYATVGLAATYTMNNVKITGGVTYIDIGDAITSADGAATTAANFTGNTGLGGGVKIGISF